MYLQPPVLHERGHIVLTLGLIMKDNEDICTTLDQQSLRPNQWAINATILILAIPVAYKIAITPFSLQIDLNGLLSLLLALFSVGLSAMFYFKANETSNSFYNNTYKFTKDIAELLVRIESGFGERLRHIDEGYTSMRDYIQTSNTKPKGDVEKTKQKIESEEHEIEKVSEERNNIIKQLVERSQLQEEEKLQFTTQLKAKEEELSNVHNEIAKLNRRLAFERLSSRLQRNDNLDFGQAFKEYTTGIVIPQLGVKNISVLSQAGLRRRFENIKDKLSRSYLRDMVEHGLYIEQLTNKGADYLKKAAKDFEK